jgi:hypothetical protein
VFLPIYSYFSVLHEWIRVKRETNLDISLGLIRDLHEELGSSIDHMLEDPLIDAGRGER